MNDQIRLTSEKIKGLVIKVCVYVSNNTIYQNYPINHSSAAAVYAVYVDIFIRIIFCKSQRKFAT